MKIVAKVHHNRRKRLKADNTAPVEIEAYYAKKRLYFNTKISVEPKHWSKSQCKVTKVANADLLNSIIRQMLDRIEEYEKHAIEESSIISLEKLKLYMQGDTGSSMSLVSFARKEIENSTVAYRTIQKNNSVINTFEKHMGDIAINNYDYSSIVAFDRILRTELEHMENTVVKYHRTLSKFMSIAVKKGIIKHNPYVNFKIGSYVSTREALTLEEIKKLEDLVIPSFENVLQQVRDMFLFSCYTGLRFSDMQALTKNELIKTDKGLRIRFVMQKVDRANEFPLYALFDGKPEVIVLNYVKNDSINVFPKITNQAMNRNLKALAIAMQSSVKLTSHIARHTFGSILADITQNPYLIMQLMGHRDIKTSMIYIHLSQKRIEKQLEGLSWKL